MNEKENIAQPAGDSIEKLLINIAYKIYNCVELDLAVKFKDAGIKRKQLSVLISLINQDSPTPTTVARHTGISRSQVTSILDTLETDGYLRRILNHEDRRRLNIELLPKGEYLVNSSNQVMNSLPKDLFTSLSKDEMKALTFFLREYSL